MGQNGIISKSKDSVDKYNQAAKNELDILSKLENKIDDLINNIPKEEQEEAFIYLMGIPNDNRTYTINLPTGNFEYNFEVDWGDGTKTNVTSQTDTNKIHTYNQEGEYIVKIKGKAQGGIFFEEEKRLEALITGYPESMNVTQTSFAWAFAGCMNLSGSIPENLFANTPNVIGFYYTFYGCSNLSGNVPENLFANTPNVISFGYAFSHCSNLSGSIPENLFANTPNVTSFTFTFAFCDNLSSIPKNLFANTPNVADFNSTFYNCRSLTGNGIALWERANVTSYQHCYSLCTNLFNYSSIPDGWK